MHEDILSMSDEPLTVAMVFKMKPEELRSLRKYLFDNKYNLIYKTVSYAPLYISKTKDEEDS